MMALRDAPSLEDPMEDKALPARAKVVAMNTMDHRVAAVKNMEARPARARVLLDAMKMLDPMVLRVDRNVTAARARVARADATTNLDARKTMEAASLAVLRMEQVTMILLVVALEAASWVVTAAPKMTTITMMISPWVQPLFRLPMDSLV